MVELADTIFRDFVTDGVPASGTNKPRKSNIREWGTWLESIITAFTSNGGLIYDTKAHMDADLLHDANSSAWVVGDATVANNGIYRKLLGSGAGSWTRVADLPYSFIQATDVGAGTANAIIATSSIPIPVADVGALIALKVFEANAGSPVTVAFNGGAPLTIKTASGNDVAADGLVSGMVIAGYKSGSTFRLMSDQASAAIVAAAEAAQIAAEAAAADAAASAASATGVVPVVDRAAMQALDETLKKGAKIYGEGGRNGDFVPVFGNLSALVTADTQKGIYVPFGSDLTGASGAWVRQNDGKIYATWFGFAEANSAATNTTALTAALNFARIYIGSVHISHGDYNLNAVTITMTGNSDALRIVGDGYARTNLRFNNTSGLTITMIASSWWLMGDGSGPGNSVTVEGLSFVQGVASGAVGSALTINGNGLVGRPAPFTLIKGCEFRGDKSGSGWNIGVGIVSLSSATIENCYWHGVLAGALGTPFDIDASVGKDASPFHIRGCEAYYFLRAVACRSYCEGLHITDCDFVGGTNGVQWDATTSGAESQLCMVGTHINVTARALLLTGIQHSQITGNLLWVTNANAITCQLTDCSSSTITGNVMAANGATSSCVFFTTATWTSANYLLRSSAIVGNTFETDGTGVSLASAVRKVTVKGNSFTGVTTECTDVSLLNDVWDSAWQAWTPLVVGSTVSGAGTYTLQAGVKKREGKKVSFGGNVTWTAHTGTGNIEIGGMGFTNNASSYAAVALVCGDLTFTGVPTGRVDPGGIRIRLLTQVSATPIAAIAMDAAATIAFSGAIFLD